MTENRAALAAAARRLIRHARSGVLATLASGAPFASLVTPAAAPDLSPLLFLSRLARHTQNLAADPRCSLLLAGPAADLNPQTTPRVTLLGTAAPVPAPEAPPLRSRWLALHPYALPYADLADFSLWRLSLTAAHFVAGFAATARLAPAELMPEPHALAALAAAEPAIIAHCNAEHEDAMSAIATLAGGSGAGWRLVAVDADGCDLAQGETVLRIDFAAPVSGPDGVRAELIRLARAAREGPKPGPG